MGKQTALFVLQGNELTNDDIDEKTYQCGSSDVKRGCYIYCEKKKSPEYACLMDNNEKKAFALGEKFKTDMTYRKNWFPAKNKLKFWRSLFLLQGVAVRKFSDNIKCVMRESRPVWIIPAILNNGNAPEEYGIELKKKNKHYNQFFKIQEVRRYKKDGKKMVMINCKDGYVLPQIQKQKAHFFLQGNELTNGKKTYQCGSSDVKRGCNIYCEKKTSQR